MKDNTLREQIQEILISETLNVDGYTEKINSKIQSLLAEEVRKARTKAYDDLKARIDYKDYEYSNLAEVLEQLEKGK